MKKLGRKRPAASATGETKCDSSQGEGKKGTKNNAKAMDTAGQTKISSFFSKAPNFTSNKEVSESITTNNEATTSSINKHVNSFRKRLSLGGKKSSKVNILEKFKKTTGVIEENEVLETPSEVNPIYQNENVNYNLNNQITAPINKLDSNVKTFVKSPCKRRPHVTSTPNKSRVCEEKAPIVNSGSLIRKQNPISDNKDTSDDSFLQSPEPEKRQKMSISIENMHSIHVFDENEESARGKVPTKIKENDTDNSFKNSTMVEFEFENSIICENTCSKKNIELSNQRTLNKTNEMQKLNLNDNMDCTADEKAIADALENESFQILPNLNCDENARNDIDKNCDKYMDAQPLSFYYGRHIVQSVENDASWGDIYLKAKKDVSIGKKSAKLRNVGADRDDTKAPQLQSIILRGSWAQTTKVKKGDVINILNVSDGDSGHTKELVVDDSSNVLIVINPDMLMAGTSIVSTLFCMRKAVLNEWYKGMESTNRVMFIGTLLHEVLQQCLKKQSSTLHQIRETLDACLSSVSLTQDMLTLKITADDVKKEVDPFLCHIEFFVQRYVLGKTVSVPPPAYSNQSCEKQKGNKPQTTAEIWPGQVDEVRDIEENIWSPRLGIKGKVDLTLHVNLHKKDKQGRTEKTVPLELKTGRPSGSAEHRGQVILYSMMMSERWPDPQSGLLLYLRNSSITEVQAGVHEIRGLVQLRNQLVYYITGNELLSNGHQQSEKEDELAFLPEPINLRRACEQCSHLNVCTLYQKLGKLPSNPKHAMHELVPQSTDHLTEQELEFFANHSSMAQLESKEAKKFSRIKNIWCNTPLQREETGNAIANLQLLPLESHRNENLTTNDYRHVFEKFKSDGSKISKCVFNIGELVMVGTQGMIALTQGTVNSVDEQQIILTLDRNLHNLQVLHEKHSIFYIDRYEYTSGSSYNLVNLAKLMSSENPIAMGLRNTLVNQGKDATFMKGLPKEYAISPQAKLILRPLNRVQQKAVFRVMMAEQFVLLEGMPGCGKTTVIVALIRLLLTLGKSVLLTSYTHSAVDNVLLKMMEKEKLQPELSTPFLRIGKSSRINPQVYAQSAEQRLPYDSKTSSLQQHLSNLYESVSLVATTCLGINHPAITTKREPFDYCILDEAGQCLLLSALGPLFHAKKFVLVGDPHQLPPLVQSQVAQRKGMDISLFSHLATKPDNIIPLTMQYRMNEKIQELANNLTYEGRLECGSEEVAKRTIVTKGRTGNTEEPGWITRLLDGSSIENSLLFLSTDNLDNAMETTCDLGLYNPGEGDIVDRICQSFQSLTFSGEDQILDDSHKYDKPKLTIGVIAPYRAQVMHLRNKLISSETNMTINVNTVDQFQGQDKDIIIYSCTRSTPQKIHILGEGSTKEQIKGRGDIMCDKRRLNVAITRAKSKLVIIGNIRALQTYDPFKNLLSFLQEKGNVFEIYTSDLQYLKSE